MAEPIGRIVAIKRYFERDDAISPGGGRPVLPTELKALTPEDRAELAPFCAAELGAELKTE